jgi:hypothetical protein
MIHIIPKYIIMHHSLTKDGRTVSWGAIREYHKTAPEYKFSEIGYQWGIELVGPHYEVLAGRMMNENGAHCPGRNNDSVGICVVGNFDIAPPPVAQWAVAVHLASSLCDVLRIPYENIKGHCDYSQKSCPGKYFDMNTFRRDVMKYKIAA